MKRITIIETRNGVLVVDGDAADHYSRPEELAGKVWTFNSLDKAVGQIRSVLKQWRDVSAAKAGGDDG